MSVTHYHVLRQGGGWVFVTSLHLKLRPCQQKKNTHSKVQRSDFSCEQSMYCSHVKKCPVSTLLGKSLPNILLVPISHHFICKYRQTLHHADLNFTHEVKWVGTF